jgi:hypothetical protein
MFPVVFLGPKSNPDLVPKILVALYVSHAAVTKIFAKTQPSQSDQNSHNAAPSPKIKFSPPVAQLLSPAAYSPQSTYRHLTIFFAIVFYFDIILVLPLGASCGALQAERSRVRFPIVLLEFFIEIILPTALWP